MLPRSNHFVSESCRGEDCGPCRREKSQEVQSSHKVGEEIAHDDPNPNRHNLTQYVCCSCYVRIVGPAAPCAPKPVPKPEAQGEPKSCRNCKWSGMDMDLDPYCCHPTVAKDHPYGLVLHNPKIGKFCERETLPLWEPREGP